MRSLMAVVLAGLVGSAAASGDEAWTASNADGNDYSARLFYSMNFGGPAAGAHAMGLRFDNDRAALRGAPALFQASLDSGQALPSLKLQGVEVAGPAVAAQQGEGGGMFSGLSFGQIAGLVFTGLVFTTIVVEASDDDETAAPSGTGGG
jgi:hypothetical protein